MNRWLKRVCAHIYTHTQIHINVSARVGLWQQFPNLLPDPETNQSSVSFFCNITHSAMQNC